MIFFSISAQLHIRKRISWFEALGTLPDPMALMGEAFHYEGEPRFPSLDARGSILVGLEKQMESRLGRRSH